MLIGLAIPGRINPEFTLGGALFGAAIYPFAEEFLFRGYAFHQLHRRAGLNLWIAALIVGIAFGVAHLGSASVKELPLAGEIATVAIISIGGILYAWLFARWNDNLWVPFGMHALMNLWWDLFDVSATALGGWYSNVLRLLTVILIIVLTIYRDRLPGLARCAKAGD
jgi:membrane protease YdiL (CAAX protease family)